MTITFNPPGTPLTCTAELALGADLTADPATWSWTTVTSKVRFATGVGVQAGRADQWATTDETSAELTFDNSDGRFTRRNPLGPYYGQLTRNTPLRVGIDAGEGVYYPVQQYVTEWPSRWDKSRQDATVPIKCAGIRRRLAQGAHVKSPMLRTNLAAEPSVYLPLEDGQGATQAASGLPDGRPGTIVGTVTFGSTLVPAGGSAAADLRGGGLISVSTGLTQGVAGSGNGWDIEVAVGIDEYPLSLTAWHTPVVIRCPGGVDDEIAIHLVQNAGQWVWGLGVNQAAGGGSLSYSTTSVVEGTVYHFRVLADQNGAQERIRVYIDGVLSASNSYAQTLYMATEVAVNGTTGDSTLRPRLHAASVSHVTVWNPVRAAGATSGASASAGWVGEQTHERLARVCDEEDVLFSTSATLSAALGVQPVATLLDVLDDAAAPDMGMLYQADFGLAFQGSDERLNATAAMTLSFDQLADAPEPADDDARFRNRWTVSRTEGSSATVEDADSIEADGLYDDSARVNVESDTQLPDQAGWRVRRDIVDEDRWPVLTLNFANSSVAPLIADFTAMGLGARVDLTSPPSQAAPDDVITYVEGITQWFTPLDWTATLNTSQGSVFQVGILSGTSGDTDPVVGRLAEDASVLDAAVSSGATTWAVRPVGTRWTSNPDDFDPDLRVRVSGEIATVSAIADASAFVAVGTATWADNASVVPGMPAGTQSGDLLLVLAAIRRNAITVAAPTGYTLLAGGTTLGLFGKIHSGSESAPTVAIAGGSAGDTIGAQMCAFRGMVTNITQVVLGSAAQTNGVTQDIAYPALAPGAVDCRVVVTAGHKFDDLTSVATPSGMTMIGSPSSVVGNDASMTWGYVIQSVHADRIAGTFSVTGGTTADTRALVAALAGTQTFTVSARAVNGVSKAQVAGERVSVADPLILTL